MLEIHTQWMINITNKAPCILTPRQKSYDKEFRHTHTFFDNPIHANLGNILSECVIAAVNIQYFFR